MGLRDTRRVSGRARGRRAYSTACGTNEARGFLHRVAAGGEIQRCTGRGAAMSFGRALENTV